MATQITNLLGGSLLESVKGIIDSFHTSPEVKAQLQAALDANAASIRLKEYEMQEAMQNAISAEVQAAQETYRAELTQDDKFTKRWRPTFGYAMTFIFVWNYAVLPTFRGAAIELPIILWQTFGGLLLVAIGARTWEKINSQNQAAK